MYAEFLSRNTLRWNLRAAIEMLFSDKGIPHAYNL